MPPKAENHGGGAVRPPANATSVADTSPPSKWENPLKAGQITQNRWRALAVPKRRGSPALCPSSAREKGPRIRWTTGAEAPRQWHSSRGRVGHPPFGGPPRFGSLGAVKGSTSVHTRSVPGGGGGGQHRRLVQRQAQSGACPAGGQTVWTELVEDGPSLAHPFPPEEERRRGGGAVCKNRLVTVSYTRCPAPCLFV